MNVSKYLNNLPDEVLANGEFCVTRFGDKQPYDPFKNHAISAKDQFYSIFDLVEEIDLHKYETLGLKASNGFSIIDIDDCVVNGTISDFATSIISRLQSYTELSPSGKGIRILFKTSTKFDFEKYKTKESKLGLEYYDADDQAKRGARMCRLSGDTIFPYSLAEVDTQWLLDKHLKRSARKGKSKTIEDAVDWEWVELVSFLLKHRVDIKPLLNRELDMLGESEWDLMICNSISEYTLVAGEIMEIFKATKYYETKGVKSSKKNHKNKWDGGYGWTTVGMCNSDVVRLKNETSIDVGLEEWLPELVIAVAVEFGLTKMSYFKKYKLKEYEGISNKQRVTVLRQLKSIAGNVGVIQQKINVRAAINKLLEGN